jgi:TonB family protein
MRMVLWHELAHVQRGDAATFVFLRLLSTPLWINSLIWLTLGKLRELAEAASDEIVLERGIKPSEYAEHLLSILHALKRGQNWTLSGAKMTRRSFKHMGGRIMKILTTNRKTLPARPIKIVWIVAMLFTAAICIGSCQLSGNDNLTQAKSMEKLPAADEFVPLTTMPELIEQPQPEYPEEAKKNEIEGVVYVKALVLSTGVVHEVRVQKSSGNDLLDKSAIVAGYKSRFKPGMIDNDPVACWVTYKVEFKLEQDKFPSDSE